MNQLLTHKLNVIFVFISSFGFGAFLTENHKIIGNIIGAVVSTLIIELIKHRTKNKKNDGSK